MAHVICQLVASLDRSGEKEELTLTWSDGPAHFESYHIRKVFMTLFLKKRQRARQALQEVVKHFWQGEVAKLPAAYVELAWAGYELYEALFSVDVAQQRLARQVRDWLEALDRDKEIDRLEVINESPFNIPWNIVYGSDPQGVDLAGSRPGDADWDPFWGLRYDLTCCARIDILRRRRLWSDPRLLLVVDEEIAKGLPANEQRDLEDFIKARNLERVSCWEEVKKRLRQKDPPDLLYWLSHATVRALSLGSAQVKVEDLVDVCRDRFEGLAFLNACRTGQGEGDETFFEALTQAGLSGLVGTEARTLDRFASPFGLAFLEGFLKGEESIGRVLCRLRKANAPLGLLYTAFCPPDLRVRPAAAVRALEAAGLASVAALAEDRTPLPDHPYRSLSSFEREDRPLFTGRDDDVRRFGALLGDAQTRLLVLHGDSGVGKSSFLRAGVIPYLEEAGVGYQLLSDRGGDARVVFIRATNDPLGQLAGALHAYCARPFEVPTPAARGQQPVSRTIDLAAILAEAALPEALRARVGAGPLGPELLGQALRADPPLLGRALTAVTDRLPFGLLLILDQAEEMFTPDPSPADESNGRLGLEALRAALGQRGDFKFIVSLRTEFYGRLSAALRGSYRDALGVREYLLTDLNEVQLVEAIRRPTSDDPGPYAVESPRHKYGFEYAPGVPEEIARGVLRLRTNRQDSPLPLVQVICTQLYEIVKRRGEALAARKDGAATPQEVAAARRITADDLRSIGGVEEGIRRHVEALVVSLFPQPEDQKAFRATFARLYVRQADGTLMTGLLPEPKLRDGWTGPTRFGKVLQQAERPEVRLLRSVPQPGGGAGAGRLVALAHDALAKVAAAWDEELTHGADLRRKIREVRHAAHIHLALQAWEEGQIARTLELLERERPEPGQDDPRGFAWYYLWGLCHAERLTLTDHARPVIAVAFSPDGRLLATGSEDTTACLWDAASGRLEATLRGHLDVVTAVAFSPDGKLLATASLDHSVRLWDVAGRKEIAVLEESADGVEAVAFSPDGQTLASSGRDWGIVLWDVTARNVREILTSHERGVCSLAFSPGGCVLAEASAPDKVILRRLRGGLQGKEPVVYEEKARRATCVTFSPSGQLLAVAYADGELRLLSAFNKLAALLASEGNPNPGPEVLTSFDAATATGVNKTKSFGLKDLGAPVSSLAFAPDGATLASAGQDLAARVWDVATGQLRDEFRGHQRTVEAVAFAPDGRTLATASRDGAVKLWDVLAPRRRTSWQAHDGTVADLAFTRDSGLIASAGEDGTVRLWDVATRAEVAVLKADSFALEAVAFSPDGQVLAAAGKAGTVRLWDVNTRLEVKVLADGKAWLYALAFSPDGQTLAAGGENLEERRPEAGKLGLWDSGAGRLRALLPGHRGLVRAVAFSLDGRILASAGDDETVRLWNTSTGETRAILHGHDGWVYAVALDAGGKVVASGGDDETVHLWDAISGQPLARLDGHTDLISVLAFSPDGRTLASASYDRSVRLWDAGTGQEQARLSTADSVTALAFSPDGRVLACGEQGGRLRLWEGSP